MLGTLSSAGIQSSSAGTALKNMHAKLLSPSKKGGELMRKYGINVQDLIDRTITFQDVLGKLGRGKATAQEMLEMFGLRGGPGGLVLTSENQESMEAFVKLLGTQGTLTKIADVQMKGLYGAITEMMSAVDGLNVAMGDAGLNTIITSIAKGIKSFAGWLTNLPAPIKTTIAVLFGLLGIMGPVLLALGQMGMGLLFLKNLGMYTVLKQIAVGMFAFSKGAIATLIPLLPLIVIIASLATIVYSIYWAFKNWDKIVVVLTNRWNSFKQALISSTPQWIKDVYGWLEKISNILFPIGEMMQEAFGGGNIGVGAIGRGDKASAWSGNNSIGNLYNMDTAKSQSNLTADINLNAPQGVVQSANVKTSGSFKKAPNIGGNF